MILRNSSCPKLARAPECSRRRGRGRKGRDGLSLNLKNFLVFASVGKLVSVACGKVWQTRSSDRDHSLGQDFTTAPWPSHIFLPRRFRAIIGLMHGAFAVLANN